MIHQILPSFILSASVVIVITLIAENYGTKLGGILGTLPSTIVIAFVFIGLNRGPSFASRSAAVVPAEMGINILFLFVFAVLAFRKLWLTLVGSLSLWAVCSSILYFSDLHNIYISLFVYGSLLLLSFFILEKKVEVRSVGKVDIDYTPKKIVFRGLLAGTVITISVFLSNYSSVLSGIFSVFPAIFLSTMLIFITEHGPRFAGGSAKSMIFGTPSVVSYSVGIYFLYPRFDLILGTLGAYALSLGIVSILLYHRDQFS